MADTPEQEMSEEEKMAAEWASGEGDAATARVLSQNEIDSLLGFGDGNAGAYQQRARQLRASADARGRV